MAKQEIDRTGARTLAREAAEESRAGHKEEARFVVDEAKKLGPAAVKEEQPRPAAKPREP